MMLRLLLIVVLLLWVLPLLAEPAMDEAQPWYEQRRAETPGYHFPHRLHEEALQQAGLSCVACHAFSANEERDPKLVHQLTRIANEPMEAICHSCHVVDRSAPMACRLCHPDPSTIWPDDHNFDYRRLHGLDARQDEAACESCHLGLRDCVSCHFQRSPDSDQHLPGFRYSHGIEARATSADCGRCHNPGFCVDC
ncbi:MAG: hypothetical protein MI754_11355, partial [Chromatiales bacterium]|nr:hypothetical protein [Chromatiales bacterium]